jgi:hypothetical protein
MSKAAPSLYEVIIENVQGFSGAPLQTRKWQVAAAFFSAEFDKASLVERDGMFCTAEELHLDKLPKAPSQTNYANCYLMRERAVNTLVLKLTAQCLKRSWAYQVKSSGI